MDEHELDDLLAAFDVSALRSALALAYERGRARGVIEGQQVIRDSILRAVSAPMESVPNSPPVQRAEVVAAAGTAAGTGDAFARRAPKGLTQTIITMVLEEEDGLPLSQIVERAMSLDERLSSKTIYNTLNLQKERYRLEGERWFLQRDEASPLIGNAAVQESHLVA